jgi:phosphate:Na+ symporter
MDFEILTNALGGLALFLLAMLLMTEGLSVFAGGGLKQLLGRWTSTPLRGVFAGILVTGVVQSSSAVTVATIGFVNAGVLTLRQALGVIFGTNVGTTMTGWLVSLVGFGFKIEAFALPILTLGVMLRLGCSSKRCKGLGMALAGFGLFFLGLAFLKDATGGLAAAYGASVAQGSVSGNLGTFLLVGFVATVLTQSSSAAIAIVLTAAASGMLGIENAAAAVIGANLGTTSTALIAVLKATPNAKRLALGHIAFNVLTGIVALALLPVLLWLVAGLGDVLDIEGSPAAVLALFHSVFNIMGVAIMLPLAGRLEKLLLRMFHSAEEDMGRPRHLDLTLPATPALAVSALHQELLRLRAMVAQMMQDALSGTLPTEEVEKRSAAVHSLAEAVTGFVGMVRTEAMPRSVADELAHALFTVRYLQEAARLSPRMLRLRRQEWRLPQAAPRASLEEIMNAALGCVALASHAQEPAEDDMERTQALKKFQDLYGHTKQTLLDAAVNGELSVQLTDGMLDLLSATRRAVEQLVKGDRLLRSPAQAREIEAEKNGNGQTNSPAA